MKSFGIVRRIDDLGRIVIPREIRRTMNIGEGDAMELCYDGDCLILRPYYMEYDLAERVESLNAMVDLDCNLPAEERQQVSAILNRACKELRDIEVRKKK